MGPAIRLAPTAEKVRSSSGSERALQHHRPVDVAGAPIPPVRLVELDRIRQVTPRAGDIAFHRCRHAPLETQVMRRGPLFAREELREASRRPDLFKVWERFRADGAEDRLRRLLSLLGCLGRKPQVTAIRISRQPETGLKRDRLVGRNKVGAGRNAESAAGTTRHLEVKELGNSIVHAKQVPLASPIKAFGFQRRTDDLSDRSRKLVHRPKLPRSVPSPLWVASRRRRRSNKRTLIAGLGMSGSRTDLNVACWRRADVVLGHGWTSEKGSPHRPSFFIPAPLHRIGSDGVRRYHARLRPNADVVKVRQGWLSEVASLGLAEVLVCGGGAVSDRFTCAVCGEEHEGLATDWAYGLPDVVWEIPECERAERARFNNDLCQFGERYFIRCMLEMPFKDAPGYFGWGAWAEVSWPTFERYLGLYDEDASLEPAAEGLLANELAPYSGSLGAPVIIKFRDARDRPSLHLEREYVGPLAVDQRAGIDQARYHEILAAVGAW